MARGDRDAVVKIDGLRDFRRDLKKLRPDLQKELRDELKTIAQREAREVGPTVDRRGGAPSFTYAGRATAGLRATVTSNYIGRFIEFGFHPRGGSTFVAGRNYIGRVLERDEDKIVDAVGDAVERAARKAGWH